MGTAAAITLPYPCFLTSAAVSSLIPQTSHVQILERSITLTKAQIVDELFAQNIFSKTESAQIIDTLFELMKQSLQNGEDVLISGLGKFLVKQKHGCTGGNPQTGDPMMLRPRRVITFKCSGERRHEMAQNYPKSYKNCAVCDYWAGTRQVDAFGRLIRVDSQFSKGKCLLQGGPWKGKEMTAAVSCNGWRPWAALK